MQYDYNHYLNLQSSEKWEVLQDEIRFLRMLTMY
jgi:hypothetical protein